MSWNCWIRIYILSRSLQGELNVHSCVRHRKVISSCLYLGLWRYLISPPHNQFAKELGEFLTMTEDQSSQELWNPERTHGQRKLQLLLITIYWNIVCTLCNSIFSIQLNQFYIFKSPPKPPLRHFLAILKRSAYPLEDTCQRPPVPSPGTNTDLLLLLMNLPTLNFHMRHCHEYAAFRTGFFHLV